MTAPRFPYADLAACAEREVSQRQRVYARQVALGRMREDKAAVEIAMMQAIAAELREKAGRDSLFGGAGS